MAASSTRIVNKTQDTTSLATRIRAMAGALIGGLRVGRPSLVAVPSKSSTPMRTVRTRAGMALCGATLVAATIAPATPAEASGIRIVTYNINADTGVSTPKPGLDTVLQAIGNEHLAGNTQPIDVLALQELYFTPSTTLQPLVDSLNAIYGAGTYAFDPLVGQFTGNSTGNGPNGLVYNTHTIQVLQAVGIGSVSGSGAARQPIRYKLHPIGYQSGADFYIYVSHYKASSGQTNADRRTVEATTIRNDADALGASAHIIYSGDFNLTGGSPEAAYQKLISAGNGQAHDIAVPSAIWNNSTAYVNVCTESATSLTARFDFQMVTGAVLNQPGLQIVSASYIAFGNNGTTPFGGSVNSPSNTALSDLANRSQVLSYLTTVTDHLPVVADYNVVGLTYPDSPSSASASQNPVCDGGSTTLNATVPGDQTVDWYTGGCGTTFVGTGTSLPVTPPSSTTYFARARVVSTGQISTNCASVAVTAAQSAAINTQPTAQTSCPSRVANFTVGATGTAPVAYQWQVQDASSPDGWSDLVDGTIIVGGQTVALVTGSPTNTLHYTFYLPDGVPVVTRCKVSNTCGQVISNSAALTVLPDINNDGFVNTLDLGTLLAYFGQTVPMGSSGDVNGDSVVNSIDLGLMLNGYGRVCP